MSVTSSIKKNKQCKLILFISNKCSKKIGVTETYFKMIMQAPAGLYIYRVSQEECARLRESVPYVKVYRYDPKHLCPKLNGYGDNGQRNLKL